MKARYYRRRQEWIERLGSACQCGSTDDLQFDHVDPSAKTFDVGKALAGWSEVRLATEMSKCQLLCGDCHQTKTSTSRKEAVQHGTYWMYRKYKCRCDDCVAANSAQLKAWKEQRKQGSLAQLDKAPDS